MSETTTTTTTTLEDQVRAVFEGYEGTPYKAAKIVNKILEANELPTIPPQMVYQYVIKGYIKGGRRVEVQVKKGKSDTREGWVIDGASMTEWTVKYVQKNLSK